MPHIMSIIINRNLVVISLGLTILGMSHGRKGETVRRSWDMFLKVNVATKVTHTWGVVFCSGTTETKGYATQSNGWAAPGQPGKSCNSESGWRTGNIYLSFVLYALWEPFTTELQIQMGFSTFLSCSQNPVFHLPNQHS